MDDTAPRTALGESVLELLAAQWAALGLAIEAQHETRVVDPEALIIATASLADRSARLVDVSVDWSVANGRYVNVSRLRHLTRSADSATREALAWYAGRVRDAGGPVWPMAHDLGRDQPSRGRVSAIEVQGPAALLLRLRALVGVNARAEVLLRLAAAPAPAPLGVAELARLAGYTKQTIAATIVFLADADAVVIVRDGHRDSVRLAGDGGIAWLGTARHHLVAPDWAAILPLLVGLGSFLEKEWSVASPSISAQVQARVVAMAMDRTLAQGAWPRLGKAVGAAFAHAFDRWTDQLAAAIAVQ